MVYIQKTLLQFTMTFPSAVRVAVTGHMLHVNSIVLQIIRSFYRSGEDVINFKKRSSTPSAIHLKSRPLV